jgi:glutamate racemase
MRKTAPWPVDWIDPAEAIARRAMSLLEPVTETPGDGEPDLAVFTSGKVDLATRRLIQGFGLTAPWTTDDAPHQGAAGSKTMLR